MSEPTKPHILIFPFPAQGHMLALLDLAHQLSLRSLPITILITPKNLPILTPLLSTHPTIQTLILPFPTHHHSSIPQGVENMKDLPFSGFPDMIFALGKLHDPLLEWFKSHPSPPTAVVYDLFLGWTQHLCRRVGVPGYSFCPGGGMFLSIFYDVWCDKPTLVDDHGNKIEMITFPKVPKSPSFPWWQILSIYRWFVENKEDPVLIFVESAFTSNLSSDGLIVNTFSNMEDVYLAYLKEILGHERVWAVGPLLRPDDDIMTCRRGGSSSISDDEVSKWLDKCENRSVVYVCFGSQVVLTNEQIEALTRALERSWVKFVLVMKGATSTNFTDLQDEKYGSIPFPSGFEELVAGRGLVIKGWAPQVLILKHPAVGAFLSHCGWNAVLELIQLAGVPMLVWPMFAVHFAHASLIVDELKIGARVCEGLEAVPDSEELAVLLVKVIGEFDEVKRRGIELHKASLAAIREDGSSFKGLSNLVAHFSEQKSILCNKNDYLNM